jgi:membrane protease YdiL (CAAX protease family)
MISDPYPTPAEATTPRPVPGIRPLDANRAMLFVLLTPSLLLTAFSALLSGGLAVTLTGALTLALLFVLFKEPMARLLRDPWLRAPPQFGVVLGTTLLAFFASRGVILFIGGVAPELLEAAPQYEALLGTASPLDLALTFLGVAVLVPLYEELVFRGLALRAYGLVRTALFAALVTSFLFAVVHVLPMQVLPILPLGFILARAVQSRGSFWTAFLVHSFNNALAVGLLIYVLSQGLDLEALAGAQDEVTVGMGLVGLAVAALCLFIAVRWLRVPKTAPPAPGPILSGSLALVLLFSLVPLVGLLFGLGTWPAF